MKIFWKKIFLYTFDADNTTFFLKDQKPVTVRHFLDLNKSKCKIAGLSALKRVKLALCEMEYIDLMFNTIKILGVYYPYDKN